LRKREANEWVTATYQGTDKITIVFNRLDKDKDKKISFKGNANDGIVTLTGPLRVTED